MSLEVVVGDIGVDEVTACASAVDGGISVADVCTTEVITIVAELIMSSVILGDTVSSGMSSKSLILSPSPNPDPRL